MGGEATGTPPSASVAHDLDHSKMRSSGTHRAPLVAFEIRRRPTLPGTLVPSTIGAGGLNCRVQNGNGCDPAAIATENQLCPDRRCSRDSIQLSRATSQPLQYSTANTNTDNDRRCE